MTFIGVATFDDRAEVVTDEGSYTTHLAKVRRTSKLHPYPHLDCVLTTSGNPRYSWVALQQSISASIQADSFDELVEAAPQWLEPAREAAAERQGDFEMISGTVHLIGRSDRLGRWAAYTFPADKPEGTLQPDFYVTPWPFTARPSSESVQRLVRSLRRTKVWDEDELASFYQGWMSRPPLPKPEKPEEWPLIADLCRRERTLIPDLLRVQITGRLRLTTLTKDQQVTEVIHSFDDTNPADLAVMTSGSLHPISQIGPCPWCESGAAYIDCCAREYLDKPCDCGSQRTFADCCSVADHRADVQLDQLWTTRFDW